MKRLLLTALLATVAASLGVLARMLMASSESDDGYIALDAYIEVVTAPGTALTAPVPQGTMWIENVSETQPIMQVLEKHGLRHAGVAYHGAPFESLEGWVVRQADIFGPAGLVISSFPCKAEESLPCSEYPKTIFVERSVTDDMFGYVLLVSMGTGPFNMTERNARFLALAYLPHLLPNQDLLTPWSSTSYLGK